VKIPNSRKKKQLKEPPTTFDNQRRQLKNRASKHRLKKAPKALKVNQETKQTF